MTGRRFDQLLFLVSVLVPVAVAQVSPTTVTVALGKSAESVVLTVVEGGGYTLDGEPFSGGDVALPDGSATYTLALVEEAWVATFKQESFTVWLGTTGEAVMINTVEGGGYMLPDGSTVPATGTVAAMNGNAYSLVRVDGALNAVYSPIRHPHRRYALGGTLQGRCERLRRRTGEAADQRM